MSNDLNRCEFIGRLGKDPDVRYAPDGGAICNFSLAVGWKTSGKEGTEWVRVVAFGKLGQICADYLTKGKQVYVSGRMTTRKWTDKDSGQDRYSTEIVADQLQMLGGKNDESEQRPASKPAARQAAPSTSDDDSEIPF
ncbi:Single-stranded DNA-binding protein [Achromobacter mucicolens]|uniref:single-stranded DNA-binding protein n=1 Tax=Achromobacter mucicolens TaxID=1389922 RepID=UPI0009D5B725|nr:single-stranded DNA-binding protein [Achromobacter mucicolens]OXC91001.1 single-stranded DNA-binding protein [Achromobacter sp. KAs 3-5]CAB3654374.1 Single-stranded DNA-binding protein [Achromobacter mucicolens]